jgi:menaquinone-dependent protoporphyrinogen oxidase
MQKVLVVYASRMGSTREIAVNIGEQLARRGLDVDVRPTTDAQDARLYAAVIVGSSIYLHHWDRDALRYLEQQAPDLAERPTWLFQSGPCGPDQVIAPQRAITKLCSEIGLEPPTTFGGNLDPARAYTWLTRLVAKGDLVGDFRDWDQIQVWADEVADRILAISLAAV